jgi:hypothetical protein
MGMMATQPSNFKTVRGAKETVEFAMQADTRIRIAYIVDAPRGYQIRHKPHKEYRTVRIARRDGDNIVWSVK